MLASETCELDANGPFHRLRASESGARGSVEKGRFAAFLVCDPVPQRRLAGEAFPVGVLRSSLFDRGSWI